MKNRSKALLDLYSPLLVVKNVSQSDRRDHLKWLRFYLDFCDKYKHQPRSPEIWPYFLRKLQDKKQSPRHQHQAQMAIKLYYSLFSDQNASADQIVVIEERPGKYSSPQPQVTGAKRKEPEGKGMTINPSSKRVYRKIVFYLIRPSRPISF